MLFQSLADFDSVIAACIETTSICISVSCIAMLCDTDGNCCNTVILLDKIAWLLLAMVDSSVVHVVLSSLSCGAFLLL